MSGTADSPAQPPSGTLDVCYEDDPDLLPATEAIRRIQAHVPVIEDIETLPLTDALARVLACDVTSPLDVPGHTNSAVDGFALHGKDLPDAGECTLQVVGRSFAGNPFAGSVGRGECVRIMTGAVMPQGTDTVVMLEHTQSQDHGESDRDSHGDSARATARIANGHRSGQNVRQTGEDLQAGQVMLARGTRLMPAALGMLASVGIAEVPVTRALRVAFFSTGDELRSLGETLEVGEIYDSNRYILRGMLMRLGVEFIDMGVVRDDPQQLREALDEACRQGDVVITSGGVSTGDADYIKDLLQERGQVGFWRIAIRPGRPLAFGLLNSDVAFFGLPGNPVAVMVTFYQFVQPALLTMMGSHAPPPVPLLDARCPDAMRKKPGRIEYYRAVLSRDADGALQVRPTGKTGSGLLHTMNDANCLIVLAEELDDVPAGSVVQVQPFFAIV